MKLSTKILLSMLGLFLIAAVVSVIVLGKKITISFNGAEHEYTMVIESNSTDSLPECQVRLVTPFDSESDSLVVNFDNVHPQVSALVRNDSIFVVIDSAFVSLNSTELLCVELPPNVGIELHNAYPQIDVVLDKCDLAYMLYDSPSDFAAHGNNIGALLCAESDSPRDVLLDYCNVGSFKLYGNATNLLIGSSNIGAAVVGGICNSISIFNSSIGACSWSRENDRMAQCYNSVVSASIDEGLIDITYEGEEF